MKIGILTFHRAINYGAVLQCYALQKYLSSLGHEVEIIDYRIGFVEEFRKIFFSYNSFKQKKTFFNKAKYIIGIFFNIIPAIKSNISFNSFLRKRLNISSTIYTGKNISSSNYDLYVIGSDQVWNIVFSHGFDSIFWGDNLKGKNVVTYAASIGSLNEIPISYYKNIREKLSNFKKISVRELDFQSWLKVKLDYSAILVLDPTLLLNTNDYSDIAIKPKENNYVLVYALENVDGIFEYASEIAKSMDCKVIRIMGKHSQIYKQPYTIVSAVTPEAFLGYFKYATYIIVASFHGTVFSLMFRKNFYVANSPRVNRAKGLLSVLNLSNRIVDVKIKQNIKPVDYAGFDQRLKLLKQESISYIQEITKIN